MDVYPWCSPIQKIPIVIQYLQKLPREIVHQVLNDLSILKVLQIAFHRIEFLDDCITSHLHYKEIFSCQDDLSVAVNHFILYREVQWFTGGRLAHVYSVLAESPITSPEPITLDSVLYYMKNRLRGINGSLDLSRVDYDLLRELETYHHLSRPPRLSLNIQWLDTCWTHWKWIKESKLGLNMLKADQLNLVADLIDRYPRVLKNAADPLQDSPRLNTAHLSNRYRCAAKKVLRNTKLKHQPLWNLTVLSLSAEVVPYDKYLWLLLDTLDKYPLRQDETLEEALNKMTIKDIETTTKVEGISQATTNESLINASRYPDDVAANLQTVLEGLPYIYADPPFIPRIKWPSVDQDETSKERWPRFISHKGLSLSPFTVARHRYAARRLMPRDGREYEWLQAFLEAITWIQENIEPVNESIEIPRSSE